MTWSTDLTWLTAGGSWSSSQGPAATGQVQSTFAQGGVRVAGAAATGQVQSASASSTILMINGQAATGQGAQTALISGPVASSGPAATSSLNGQTLASGGMAIFGAGATSSAPGRAAGYGFLPAPSPVRDALDRLLRYPHAAVFDKDAAAETAIRVQAEDAFYSITGDLLEVSDGITSRYFELSGMSVQDLAQAIEATGIDVSALSRFMGFSSGVLLDQPDSVLRTRSIQCFTSLLWVLFYGYAHEIAEAEHQVVQALRQMVITQAEGEWLDVWGELYGIARKQDEGDKAYAPRIPQEAFRLRVNAFGIEKAILDATGFDVRIEEPWKNIFRLDESLLSGPHKFYDGERIGYHLIQPTSNQNVDWDEVMPIIHRNRPAGVQVLQPQVFHFSFVDASDGRSVDSGGVVYLGGRLVYEDRALLDYSAIEDVSIVNHPARHQRQYLRISSVDVADQDWAPYYVVDSATLRDYRAFISHVSNESYFWAEEHSWESANGTWSELGPFVDSGHVRLP